MAEFGGDKKVGKSLLHAFEKYVVDHYVPSIPRWLETYHLTLLTIAWSGGVLLFGYLAHSEAKWLWLVSVMILCQYITDLFDGAVGRYRKTGLIRWGYYMDHFLDYVFLCSLLIGYSFILPLTNYLFFILAIFGGFMVNSYLAFSSTNELKISFFGIGPTEMRILFIVINTLIVVFGKTYMAPVLPFVLVIASVGLCVVVFQTQKQIWKLDMKIKNERK